jgi:hypothetical protein
MKPLTGHPDDVIRNCIKRVCSIVENKSVKKFYIGRSVDPYRRKSDHCCDNMGLIYYTNSIRYAICVEYMLINAFYGHRKCNNISHYPFGGVSEEYGSYIYVAVWMK